MTRNEVAGQLEAFDSLIRHPGWVLYQERVKMQADSIMQLMERAAGPDELLKLTYTYMALKGLPNPATLRDVLIQQLKTKSTP